MDFGQETPAPTSCLRWKLKLPDFTSRDSESEKSVWSKTWETKHGGGLCQLVDRKFSSTSCLPRETCFLKDCPLSAACMFQNVIYIGGLVFAPFLLCAMPWDHHPNIREWNWRKVHFGSHTYTHIMVCLCLAYCSTVIISVISKMTSDHQWSTTINNCYHSLPS